jgi:hypothetical protein
MARTMERKLETMLACAMLVAGVVLGAGSARALPDYLYGFDMDSDTSGLNTQAGFQAVTICTFAPGETPSSYCPISTEGPAGVGAGYLAGRDPITAALITPGAASDAPDLWNDVHTISFDGIPGLNDPELVERRLKIYGLAPGDYVVVLLSHVTSVGASTDFSIDGVGVGTIVGVSTPSDLWAEQSLSVPVTVGQSGEIVVGFRPTGFKINSAHLTGVLIVPEPASGLLLGSLLAAGVLGWRRLR